MKLSDRQSPVSRQTLRGKFPYFPYRVFCLLCLLAVCWGTSSCQKRQPVSSGVAGELKFQPAKFTDGIPDDYGPLIGVTQNPADAAWVGLWFQKQDRTITAVFVNVNQGSLFEKTLTIPRK